VGVNPYRLGLARDYWLDGWQTARYEARPPEIKPQRRWGDAAEAARRPPLCSATISSTKMEGKGKKPRLPKAQSLRGNPEAVNANKTASLGVEALVVQVCPEGHEVTLNRKCF